ncbi:hypothetical protein SLEP1_g48798 [Rubroshorea leprosula]|uniref:Uncharacterized protein n=1 Tax=Rubroshorea leprosula TaxID=152421 RepID=A0AAV5LXT8_9ROSI|nr:hypothetical protein SLEP1_g48798 [Rubroshorea leprosula]
MTSCSPSEPPPVDRSLPPPQPLPNILTSIQSPYEPLFASISQQTPITHPSSTPVPSPKSFNDMLVQGNSSIEPPLVTYEELVAANLDLETQTSMAEDGSSSPQLKVPKVGIPKSIWE